MAKNEHKEFLRLFMKSQRALRMYVFARVPNHHQAEDVMQEAALVLWENFESYDRNRSFEAWAFGVTRNKVLYSKRTSAMSKVKYVDKIADIIAPEIIEVASEQDHRLTFLKQCTERLPESLRQMIQLRYEKQLRVRDMSRETGHSENSIRIKLCRMRKALAECIARLQQESFA